MEIRDRRFRAETVSPEAFDERRRSMPGVAIRFRVGMAAGVLALLAASIASLAIAPNLMPNSYSVVANTTSESAAQAVEGAWLARIGFLSFGLGALVLVNLTGPRWGLWGRFVFRIYGLAMITTAVFSHMPWEDIPYDVFEDSLHSVAASTVGTAFTVGVLIVTFHRSRKEWFARTLDVVALIAAVAVPMLMFNVDGLAGLAQRVMFAVAYVWFGSETVRSAGLLRASRTPGTNQAR